MSRTAPLLALATLALSVAGCDPDVETEQGFIGLRVPELRDSPFDKLESGDPVAAGSTFCVLLDGCAHGEEYSQRQEPAPIHTVFDLAIDGPAHMESGFCIHLDDVGEVRWTFTPLPDGEASSCEADRLVMDAVPIDSLALEAHYPYEQLAEGMADPALPLPWPDDWIPADQTSLLAVAGEPLWIYPVLRDDAGTVASWSTLTTEAVANPTEAGLGLDEEDSLSPAGVVPVEGERVELALEIEGSRSAPVRVEGVAASSLVSLEVVPMYQDQEHSLGDPFVRAILRDDQGRPVRGAPVEWTLQGARADEPLLTIFNPDYAYVAIDCIPGQEEAQALSLEFTATLGELSDTLVVPWERGVCGDAEDVDDGVTDGNLEGDDEGGLDGACVCSATSPRTEQSAAWLLALLLLARGRRGRRRSRPASG